MASFPLSVNEKLIGEAARSVGRSGRLCSGWEGWAASSGAAPGPCGCRSAFPAPGLRRVGAALPPLAARSGRVGETERLCPRVSERDGGFQRTETRCYFTTGFFRPFVPLRAGPSGAFFPELWSLWAGWNVVQHCCHGSQRPASAAAEAYRKSAASFVTVGSCFSSDELASN